MLFYQQTVKQTLENLNTTEKGLSSKEALKRLKVYGTNTIVIKGEPLWRKLLEPFANVFIAVLLVAVIISVLSDAYVDAIIILAIIFASAIIYYVQRFSTEKVLRSLQKHSIESVQTLRNGSTSQVDAIKLVPGDVVQLYEGDKVPADLRIIAASNVQVNESMLTGESEAIGKNANVIKTQKPIYEQSNLLFSGSFLVSGQVTGVVISTGNETEFGRIASLAGESDTSGVSPVQNKIDKLITIVIAAVGGVSVVAFALALYQGIDASEALRFVIALAVSAIPEGLPIATSVVLVLGMRRMAKKKAFVRSMKAIETIGLITTIATDKTGTLTENRLSIQETWAPKWSKSNLFEAIARSANRNLQAKSHDPLDIAIDNYAKTSSAIKIKGSLVATLPFDQKRAMSGNVWKVADQYLLSVKGAPEDIIAESKLNDSQREEVNKNLKALTSQGYRVVAIASVKLTKPVASLTEVPARATFTFNGLIAVADTLRPVARKAIITAQNAGVKVCMITGDHFETAYNIGLKLGLVTDREQVFDSRMMDKMTDKQLREVTGKIRVFSRVTPENKFRILQVLRATEVTAMTGDGVNDVPALTNAHVGIAMGSGSQIAKDAGDIVLLNDNFASIVAAMREGRIIFSNVRRMTLYLLSTNIGEVIVSVMALAVGLPIPLHPVQILWTNLMTDTAMVIPLGLEPGEKDVIKQKPINPKAPLFSKYLLQRMAVTSVVMGVVVLAAFIAFTNLYGVDYGRTIAFSSLIVIQWASAFNARSTYESIFTRIKVSSPAFYAGLALAVGLQGLAFFGPLREALHVYPVAIGDLAITGIISFIIMIVAVEIHKAFGRYGLKKAELKKA